MVPDTVLGELVAIKHGFAFSSEYFRDEPTDRVLLTPGNFHVDKRLYFGPRTKFYDGPVPQGYSLRNGDLLVVMTDLTKDMAILGNAVVLEAEKEVLHNQRIGLVDIKAPDRIDRDYLCSLLNSDIVQRHVRATASGTTVRHTSPKRILEVRAPVPPLPEQQKIADILSTWDRAIETSEALLATARRQKRALMQSLLTGKRRFPEFEGQGWEEVRLRELVAVNPRPTVCPIDHRLTFLAMEAVSEESEIINPVEGDWRTHVKGFTQFEDGDVLVAKITPCFENGKGCHARGLVNGIGTGSTEFHVLRPIDERDVRFVFHLVNSFEFRGRGELNMQGSAGQRRVPTDFIRAYTFQAPVNPEERCKIGEALDVFSDEIEQHKAQIDKLRTEKKALMQQLLTGKRRVVV